MFGGELSGAHEGSSEITYAPGRPRLQALSVDMRTAASITLVLQAVVPAVALTGSRLSLELAGGTDVPWSPTLDYFLNVVRVAYGKIGIRFDVAAARRGYYPRGGGRVRAAVEPCESLLPLDLTVGPKVSGVRLLSRCGGLPRHVAERQLSSASDFLERSGISFVAGEVTEEPADSPGSSVLVYFVDKGAFLGSDAIGARGKPAEDVGRDAAQRFVAAAKSGACVDSNLADMLVPLLSLAERPSRVRIPQVTSHLSSGLLLAEQFTECTWSVESLDGGSVVNVNPNRAK